MNDDAKKELKRMQDNLANTGRCYPELDKPNELSPDVKRVIETLETTWPIAAIHLRDAFAKCEAETKAYQSACDAALAVVKDCEMLDKLRSADCMYINQLCEERDGYKALYETEKLTCDRAIKERDELREKLAIAKVGAGHYRSERDTHIQESQDFVTEATEKILALSKERDELREQLNAMIRGHAELTKERDRYKHNAQEYSLALLETEQDRDRQAKEIERFKLARDRRIKEEGESAVHFMELKLERDRLRAALEEVIHATKMRGCTRCMHTNGTDHIRDLARAALSHEGEK